MGATVMNAKSSASAFGASSVRRDFLRRDFAFSTATRSNSETSWKDRWESNPVTPASYNPKEEYIKHLEEKYESLC